MVIFAFGGYMEKTKLDVLEQKKELVKLREKMGPNRKIFAEYFSYNAFHTKRRYTNLFVYKDEYQYPARKFLNHYDCEIVDFVNQRNVYFSAIYFLNFCC